MKHKPVLAFALALIPLAQPAFAQEPASWLSRVHGAADLRLRAEFNDNLNPASDRHRLRGRLRMGAVVDLHDDLVAGVRFRTGNPEDPNSPHFDLGGTGGPGNDGEFDSWEMNADQVYLTWTPAAVDGLAVTGGKFDIAMKRNPVYGDLLWDQDVQPEGLQLSWERSGRDGLLQSFGATVGQYILLENGAAEDLWSTFVQAHASSGLGDAGRLDFACAFLLVGDTSPDGAASPLLDDNQGNAVNGAGTDFDSHFGTLNPMVAWTRGDLTVAAELFHNLRAADGREETGFSLGTALATPWGKFYVNHVTMGQDATFSAWSQDDFLLNSNAVNTMVGWKKPLTERVLLHVWLLASEADDPALGGPDDLVYRFRIDFDVTLF